MRAISAQFSLARPAQYRQAMSSLSRRRFTQSLGAALFAAPFLGLLDAKPARADMSKTAKRLVVFFSPNGTIHEHWRPSGSGTAFDFKPGSILEPLGARKSDVIICDGIDYVGVANHEQGMANMLTGGGGASSLTAGMSLDQFVASKIGGSSRFASLELGVQTSAWGGNVQTRMSYGGPGVFVPPDDSPKSVFDRLFGGAVGGSMGMSKLAARRKSVLDVVKGDLADLRGRVGAAEKAKLDAHLDAIHKSELASGGVTGCAAPPMGPALDPYDNGSFPALTKAQIDLLVLSLACGATNVASLQMSHTVGPPVFSWAGCSDGHHSLSHSDDSSTKGVADFVAAERWVATQFKYLLDTLAATADPGGGTLLDSTLVVWCKELGDGRLHDCVSVPWVLAGGGVFAPGRYLNFGGAPHQKLLVSICHALGLTNPTFGDPSHGTGPLDGLVLGAAMKTPALFATLLLSASLPVMIAACSHAANHDAEANGPGASLAANGAGCPEVIDEFRDEVWKPVLSVKCIGCHNEKGIAAGTRMVLKPPSETGYLEANLATMKTVAAIQLGGVPVLLLRPTGRYPDGHTGGTLIDPASADYQHLSAFVDRVTTGKGCSAATAAGQGGASATTCTDVAPGAQALRRLTHGELQATLQDLLGVDAAFAQTLVPDTVVNGFDNNAAALTVTPLLFGQLRDAAEKTADQVTVDPTKILPCSPAKDGEAACAAKFIGTFGKRAFRRPLTAAETTRYTTLYTSVAAEDGFAGGIDVVLQAMLQSPGFLYRTELGAPGKAGLNDLTPHEIAGELSYLIWGSMPDDGLFAAADSGALSDAAEIEKQARRMLKDPRSTRAMGRFVGQWLGVDQLAAVPKDEKVYPELSPEIRAAMLEETSRFVDYVRTQGTGTLPELLTAGYSVMSPALAKYYGVAGPAGADFAKTDFPAGDHAGILTQGSVLTRYALPGSSSPIHRGKFVRERLLCQKLAPPPPNLKVVPPAVDPTLTTRERFAAHSSQEPCKSCHRMLDPVGFGFERFDGIGRPRATENGLPIDAHGEIIGSISTDAPFDGVAQLGKLLAASAEVQDCYALSWFRYGYGVEENAELSCAVQGVATAFKGKALGLDELVVALTQSPRFRSRTGDGDGMPSQGGGGSGGGTGGTGSGSGGSGGTASGGSPPVDDGGAPPTLDVKDKVDSQWDQGSCHSVTVTNPGASSVKWAVTLTFAGKLTQSWNSVATAVAGGASFSGVAWNASLAKGETASFGYCIEK
jgi:uncharacterized membrane protein YgcG